MEAGAFDGYLQSNTYFLERVRGWHGILIEPIPILSQEARRERRAATVVNCGLVAPDFPDPTIELRYAGTQTIVSSAPTPSDGSLMPRRIWRSTSLLT